MRIIQTLALFLFLATSSTGVARQVTDTLTSQEGDTVFITYDLEEKDGAVEIRFIKVYKKLSSDHSEKYGYDLSYIKVVCFDRDNRLQDIVIANTGLNPRQFMIPKGLSYTKPNDDKGYFFLDEELPVLHFESHVTDSTILSIPVFLARYKKPHHYELFAQCCNLVTTIGHQPSSKTPAPEPIPEPKPVDTTGDSDPNISDLENQALIDADFVLKQLEKSNPDFERLQQEVYNLNKIKDQIQNNEIIARIEEAEQAFDKAYNNHIVCLQKEQDRLDSIDRAERQQMQIIKEEEEKRKADEEKRQKIWMIVGAVLLAVLMFVGNQVMQSIRNKKMEKKQQDAMKKAQEMARQQQQQLQQQANGGIPDSTPKRYTI